MRSGKGGEKRETPVTIVVSLFVMSEDANYSESGKERINISICYDVDGCATAAACVCRLAPIISYLARVFCCLGFLFFF